ncbi:uncharacterized protein LOC111330848 [Stylophora pistillata]|uniref:uncharacterized protein LOC111330848 n=1 Tax=Stylophora pistillata TaxID=50429 RepID=UPI000C056A3E|nr:uncharacterized protein LOC111330848 [Stylophora pistillata]
MNAQSVRNKTADFVDYVCERKYDLVAIIETWLQPRDAALRTELCPPGHKFIDFPRQERIGGGIGLLYKDSFRVKKTRDGIQESFEFCELLVQTSTSGAIRLVIVYRPQNSDNHHRIPINTFLMEFSDLMESTILYKEPLIVVGDFNIHVDVPIDTDALKFLELLESLGLEQHVTEPTHVHGHTLDLVLTRKIEDILTSPPRACHYFSDHAAVHCVVTISKPSFQTKIIKFRKTKSQEAESPSNDVVPTGLCDRGIINPSTPLDLDLLVKDYKTTLSQVLHRHAPLKTKTVRARTKVPWYTSEIAEGKRQRRKAERRSQEDLLAFKKLKNHVTYISTRAKRPFYSDFVNDNIQDQAKRFRATRSLLLPRNELCFPEYTDNSILGNEIGRFF